MGRELSVTSDMSGVPYQYFLNLPFGEEMAAQHSTTAEFSSRYKFNAKELDQETGWYYYGARYYDPSVSQWLSVDPLAYKMPSWSPYSYTFNNPVRFIDPDGRAPEYIIGVSRSDARKFKSDLHTVLSDSKFEKLRGLISVGGKTFNHIDSGALATALDGVSLSTDEQTYVDLVVNTINSDDIHKVEYLSGEFTSSEGATAFKEYMNGVQEGLGDIMLTPEGKLSTGLIDAHGGGFNVPTNNGSHSFISGGSDNREATPCPNTS